MIYNQHNVFVLSYAIDGDTKLIANTYPSFIVGAFTTIEKAENAMVRVMKTMANPIKELFSISPCQVDDNIFINNDKKTVL